MLRNLFLFYLFPSFINVSSLRRPTGLPTVHLSASNSTVERRSFVGYTDCSSQEHPFVHLLGHHSPRQINYRKYKAAIPLKVPDRDLAMCLPPKNGCTYWKALLMRMAGNSLWNDPRPESRHNPELNKLPQSYGYLDNPKTEAIMLVRNPVARLLSAFLDKASDMHGHYEKLTAAYSYDAPGFGAFVRDVSADILKGEADTHWQSQIHHCGVSMGAEYDLYLKVECRTLWSPAMFDRYSMTPFTSAGWGSDSKKPFIPVNSTPTRVPGMISNDPQGQHDNRADDVKKICHWYTEETFLRTVLLYLNDISKFNYQADVESLATACGYADALKSLMAHPEEYNYPA